MNKQTPCNFCLKYYFSLSARSKIFGLFSLLPLKLSYHEAKAEILDVKASFVNLKGDWISSGLVEISCRRRTDCITHLAPLHCLQITASVLASLPPVFPLPESNCYRRRQHKPKPWEMWLCTCVRSLNVHGVPTGAACCCCQTAGQGGGWLQCPSDAEVWFDALLLGTVFICCL